MFKIVNGFSCSSGCDVALAKKGIDPRNPHNDPVKQQQLDRNNPAKAAKAEVQAQNAVIFGGTLSAFADPGASTVSASASKGLGALVNIFA